MTALVTGGAGFIGSHLVELLLEKGHHVVVLDNLKTGHKKNLDTVQHHSHFSFCELDIQRKEIASLFANVDWVFHLAALADVVPSIDNPRDYFEVNVNGTFNVLECARQANVKRFIYAASSSCYGLPDHFPTRETAKIDTRYPYALTKYLGEEVVLHWQRVYGLPSVSLRLFNVYGPRARSAGTYGAVFGVFLTQKIHKKPFTVVGDGTQTRDFIFVTDVARAFLAAAESDVAGQVFNVGSSASKSINELVSLLQGDVVYIPKRPGEPDQTCADTSKIERLLGWKSKVAFKEGVALLLERIHEFKDAPVWEPTSIEKATAKWFQFLDRGNECSTTDCKN